MPSPPAAAAPAPEIKLENAPTVSTSSVQLVLLLRATWRALTPCASRRLRRHIRFELWRDAVLKQQNSGAFRRRPLTARRAASLRPREGSVRQGPVPILQIEIVRPRDSLPLFSEQMRALIKAAQAEYIQRQAALHESTARRQALRARDNAGPDLPETRLRDHTPTPLSSSWTSKFRTLFRERSALPSHL